MKELLIIIPGFGENTKLPSYSRLAKDAKDYDYEVVEFNPTWDRNVATGWIDEFKKILSRYPDRKINIVGFSFGAYIAVLCATAFKIDKLVLCSLSPYFSDNLAKIPEAAWKFFGKRRKEDFARHSFPTNIKSEAIFLVGELEIPLELEHVKNRYAAWRGQKELIIVANAEHSLDSGEYLKQITKVIKRP